MKSPALMLSTVMLSMTLAGLLGARLALDNGLATLQIAAP